MATVADTRPVVEQKSKGKPLPPPMRSWSFLPSDLRLWDFARYVIPDVW